MSNINDNLKREILDKVQITKPILNDVGELLKRSITKNFQDGGRHNGDPKSFEGGSQRWQDLAPSTKKARIRANRTGDIAAGDAAFNILVQRSILKNSITYRTDVANKSVWIGTNVVYGAIHHFGGFTGRGGKVRIPARPWLVVQPQDVENIIQIIAEEF